MTGGIFGCDSIYQSVLDLGLSVEFTNWLAWGSYVLIRYYWRYVRRCRRHSTGNSRPREGGVGTLLYVFSFRTLQIQK